MGMAMQAVMGPTWFQLHSCEFVTGVALEAMDARGDIIGNDRRVRDGQQLTWPRAIAFCNTIASPGPSGQRRAHRMGFNMKKKSTS
jgi:hypothetical protein